MDFAPNHIGYFKILERQKEGNSKEHQQCMFWCKTSNIVLNYCQVITLPGAV